MNKLIRRGVAFATLIAFLFAAHAEDEHARWPIKTSVPLPLKSPRSIKFEDLAALKLPPNPHRSSAHGDSTYQAKRYPAFSNSLNVREGDIVSVKGYLHLVASEDDGDYHIQISDSSTDGNNCIIVEVPDDDQGSPELRQKFAAVRQFIKSRLLKGKEPGSGGNVMRRPPYVEIAGQLFLDDWHIHDAPRGKKGMKATTLWEVHPIVGIPFAPLPQ